MLVIASACDRTPGDPAPSSVGAADPVVVEVAAARSLRLWANAWTSLRSAGAMSVQARTYTSGWNAGNLNFYSGVYDALGNRITAGDTALSPVLWTRNGAGWQNDPSAVARTSVEALWGGGLDEAGTPRPGFYGVLADANAALTAIRTNGVVIVDLPTTRRAETIAQLMQGAALMGIALNYDKGYVVDENTIGDTPPYASRKTLRDTAVAKLNAAFALASANAFTTEPIWANGVVLSNTHIARIAKTMVAMTVAYYPRDATEAAAVDWAAVEAAAVAGMSTATPLDFVLVGDGCVAWCHEVAKWMNALSLGRVATRVAYLLAPTSQVDPSPMGAGNPKPNSVDRRLGDGSFGSAATAIDLGTTVKTAGGGTDFAWSSVPAFLPERGYYQQASIGHIRFDASGTQAPTAIASGFGPAPLLTATLNDLLWAEALLRQGGAARIASAAALINKTRVTRGGLPAADGGDAQGAPADGPCTSAGFLARDKTTCTLWSKLLYENEIELLGLGPVPFYNQRHLPDVQSVTFDGLKARFVQGLLPGTPREMPVPFKELVTKGEALYTWGGTSPPRSATPP